MPGGSSHMLAAGSPEAKADVPRMPRGRHPPCGAPTAHRGARAPAYITWKPVPAQGAPRVRGPVAGSLLSAPFFRDNVCPCTNLRIPLTNSCRRVDAKEILQGCSPCQGNFQGWLHGEQGMRAGGGTKGRKGGT